jgi:Repeats of unknown function (DUF5649)
LLGDGAADSVNFGRVSLSAANANVIESSSTQLAGLQISGNLDLASSNSITDDPDAILAVTGRAKFTVSGQPQQILLDGPQNTFGSLDLTSTDINITLADSTSLTNVIADNLTINATSGSVSVASGATFTIDQQADIRAGKITFEAGSDNEVGGLSLVTGVDASNSVAIRSNIAPHLELEKPTNVAGVIQINSPNVFIGVGGGSVSLVTEGGVDGGAISISGVNDGGFADADSGTIHLNGSVTIDTTNAGASSGNNISMVSDGVNAGLIRAEDGSAESSLLINAGAGDVDLGSLDSSSRLNSFTVAGAQDVELDDVFVAGNTVQIDATGNVHISGAVDDSAGNVSVGTAGSILVDQSIAAAGDVSLQSTGSSVSVQEITANNNVTVAAQQGILLGSNTTASSGIVTLVSSESIDSTGVITAGGAAQVIAGTGAVLGSGGGDSINAAGSVSITSDSGDISLTSVSSDADVTVFSVSGKISQAKDTVVSAGGIAIVSAQDGIEVASIDAAGDVTLVITQSEVATGEDTPTFSRVNDPIPIGQGNDVQDVNSAAGSIIFLAPVADVGSAEVGQNFVQRADAGIFYGLDQGQFFSDDIGGTIILSTIPDTTLADLTLRTTSSIDTSTNLSLNLGEPVFSVDFAAFNANLSAASNAEASAGETAASSSSRSTAASQQDEDEEVAEVDELVFQKLNNYDETPQGILLPIDQNFAYDDQGNIYFIVTLSKEGYYGQKESFTLYRVDLDLHSTVNGLAEEEDEKGEGELVMEQNRREPFPYQPAFLKLSMSNSGGED